MNIKIITTAIILFLVSAIYCQKELTLNPTTSKTEDQVNNEEKFADAQREMLTGKLDKAIALYEELYKNDRTNGTVAFELVKAYAQKKDFFQVEKYSKSAMENSPGNKWVLQYLAGYMYENNRPATAHAYYRKLIELEPKQRIHYENAANCLLKQDKFLLAIELYNGLELNIGPQADIYLKRYELYDLVGNDLQAVKELDTLIAKYAGNKHYLKTKARYLTKKNRIDEAMQLYKKVLDIDSEDTDANLAILSKGEEKEKPSAYLMALLPIIINQSINIDVKVKELLPYIESLKKGDNLEVKSAVLDLANKLVLTHPDEAKAYSLDGDVLMITGDLDGAITKYEQTLKLNNKNFAVWEQLMYAYLETQNFESLTKLSNQAIDFFPNQAINFFFASLGQSIKKNYPEAISLAEEGLMVSGGNKVCTSKINAALGIALTGKQDYDKAQVALEKAISQSGNLNAFAYEALGDLYMAKGDQVKAKENWKKSAELGNKSKLLLAKIQ